MGRSEEKCGRILEVAWRWRCWSIYQVEQRSASGQKRRRLSHLQCSCLPSKRIVWTWFRVSRVGSLFLLLMFTQVLPKSYLICFWVYRKQNYQYLWENCHFYCFCCLSLFTCLPIKDCFCVVFSPCLNVPHTPPPPFPIIMWGPAIGWIQKINHGVASRWNTRPEILAWMDQSIPTKDQFCRFQLQLHVSILFSYLKTTYEKRFWRWKEKYTKEFLLSKIGLILVFNSAPSWYFLAEDWFLYWARLLALISSYSLIVLWLKPTFLILPSHWGWNYFEPGWKIKLENLVFLPPYKIMVLDQGGQTLVSA